MIGRKLLPERRNVSSRYRSTASVRGIRPDFSGLSPSLGQITYVLLSRLPLARGPKPLRPFDLHALGAPPAFVLSQDQTLRIVLGFGSFHYPVVKVRARPTRTWSHILAAHAVRVKRIFGSFGIFQKLCRSTPARPGRRRLSQSRYTPGCFCSSTFWSLSHRSPPQLLRCGQPRWFPPRL